MLRKLTIVWRNNEAKRVSASFALVLFASTIFSVFAIAQTEPTATGLPSYGTPLLVTPQAHLASAAPSVGASNATAGNAAGASNATGGLPLTSTLSAVPQYSTPAYIATIPPVVEGEYGEPPSTLQVHLGAPMLQSGARNATAGNTAGATNATTWQVAPNAIDTVPEFHAAGSTITFMPPPEAARSDAGSEGASEKGLSAGFDRGAAQSSDLLAYGNTQEKSLGEIAREYRARTWASSAEVYTDENIGHTDVQPEIRAGGMQTLDKTATQ